MNRFIFKTMLLLLCPAITLAAESPDWRFDFEAGAHPEVTLQGASVTSDGDLVINGQKSILADFSADQDGWHEFLHTTQAVHFDKGKTYAVRFQYRVVSNTDKKIEFYSQLRSFAAKGDVQGDNWLWKRPTGHTGHINRLFEIPHEGNYYLILGVRHNGAIVIDDLEIREAKPNQAATRIQLRTHPTGLANTRDQFDRLNKQVRRFLDNMLIIALNEGAGAKASNRKDEIVKDLQLDFVDWNVFGPMAKEYGIRSSSGGCEYQEYYRVEPHDLDEATREQTWNNRHKIYGDSGFVVTLENTILSNEAWGEGGYFTCHNGKNWHRDFSQSMTRAALKFLAITQDNISCSVFNRVQGCYCPGCQSGFRTTLKERFTPEQLADVGIDDPDTFSIQNYIVDHGLLGDAAVADAIVREYIKFQFITGLSAWSDCVDKARSAVKKQQRPLAVGGNQINAWGSWPYAVVISQFCDFVEIEELVGVKDKVDPRPLQYKLGLASGHHEKPVWVRGPVTDRNVEKGPMLSRSYWQVHFAEALANGGIREFSLGLNTSYTGEPNVPDYLDDAELYQLYVDFARWMREHRSLLTYRDSQARVALVYSVPSLMFRRYDALRTQDRHGLGSFENTARLLEREHIPYDAVVFGHPEIWDDGKTFARIRERYDVIILRGVDALTDDQIALLRERADAGVTLLADRPFVYDENLNSRDEPVKIPGIQDASKENIVRTGRQASPVQIEAPQHVSVNVWQSCRGDSFDVHLLNYDADVAGETMNAVENVNVRVRLPEKIRFERCLVSQYGYEDKEISFTQREDWTEIALGRLDAYAIISFTDRKAIDVARRVAERQLELDRKQVRKLANQHNLY